MSILSDNVDVFIQKHLDSLWSPGLSPDDVRLATIADKFNVSTRTLQRRLLDKGISYASLLDNARNRKLLQILAEDGDDSPADIAKMLGFADSTGFNHAFKRWYGCSLRQYRRERRLAKEASPRQDRFFVSSQC